MTEWTTMDAGKDARHFVDGAYSSQRAAVNKREQKLEVANMAATTRLNYYYCRCRTYIVRRAPFRSAHRE